MKTPIEKYQNDPQYHYLVSMLENLIEQAHFTPSELREACILAATNYEMRRVRDFRIDPRIENALHVLDNWTHTVK